MDSTAQHMRGGRGRVIIIGAGISALAAALLLAERGVEVIVLERGQAAGGKIRTIALETEGSCYAVDSGPTVFTLREVFDRILDEVGEKLDDHLGLTRLDILARHVWQGHGAATAPMLDLYHDTDASTEAIETFSGAKNASAYVKFTRKTARVYKSLSGNFMEKSPPSLVNLLKETGLRGLPDLALAEPMSTLWNSLSRQFPDKRLAQLFARYATYCGSSPFLAPATLMLIAHVEQAGVWSIAGGMKVLPRVLQSLARARGAQFGFGMGVKEIRVSGGQTEGVLLENGQFMPARAVLYCGDVAALGGGLLGRAAVAAAPAVPARARSLSARTCSMVAAASGTALHRHTVFFSDDYRREFDQIHRRQTMPLDPTLYICAQDRGDECKPPGEAGTPERLFMIANAPATGDVLSPDPQEIDQWKKAIHHRLERLGLTLQTRESATRITNPSDFHRLFPGTGGALYGRASHGWMSSFRRPGARSRIKGLYLAGGSVHPSAGVPMAALSGHLAADSLTEDWASLGTSLPVATLGGMSTR